MVYITVNAFPTNLDQANADSDILGRISANS